MTSEFCMPSICIIYQILYYTAHYVCTLHLTLNLGQLLAFITGANKFPAMGFENFTRVYFTHEAVMKYPNVSTCACSQICPAGMNAYGKMGKRVCAGCKPGSVCFGDHDTYLSMCI